MIVDRIENAPLYTGLGERIAKALHYLVSTDFTTLEEGKYKIDGDDIFAIVNEYGTRLYVDQPLEAHKRYIDVQFMAEGRELIGYTALTDHVPSQAYDEERDYALYRDEPDFIQMEQGMFAIFFPTDLHMPGMGGSEEPVKKVVIKVRF